MTLTTYILCDKTPVLQTETCCKAGGNTKHVKPHIKVASSHRKTYKAETVNIRVVIFIVSPCIFHFNNG